MEVTLEQIAKFRTIGQLWLRRQNAVRTKLDIAIEKMVKKTKRVHEDYVDQQEDLRDEHCEIDPKTKAISVNPDGSRVFTPDKIKVLRKALRNLASEHTDIDPHFVKSEDLPKTLGFEYIDAAGEARVMSDYDSREAFTYFVLPEEE